MSRVPPTPGPLSDRQKEAYRDLLYRAMIDIRTLCQSRGRPGWNPLRWRRQYGRSRLAGTLADWLHNLAFFSMQDFEGFREEWFWREYDVYLKHSDLKDPTAWDHLWCREAIEVCRAAAKTGPQVT